LIFATTTCVVLLSVAPAFAASGGGAPNDDPWESLNRKIYAFDQGLDRAIIRPAAMAYKHVLPSPLRKVVRNLLSNAGEPPTIANDILQARFRRAGKETGRFLLNTVAGVGGLFDMATGAGLDHEGTNFGVTLGRWGVKPGPYIFLPIAGPSTVRGVVGTAVNGALDPLYWINYPDKTAVSLARALVGGLDLRAESDASLKSLTADATDPYATIRSAYLQNLQSQVSGESVPIQSLPDFDDATSPPPASKSPSANPPGGTEPGAGDKSEPAPAPETEPQTTTPAQPPTPNTPAPGVAAAASDASPAQ
jgi:phospholipid-binding lipoprotein MlaA